MLRAFKALVKKNKRKRDESDGSDSDSDDEVEDSRLQLKGETQWHAHVVASGNQRMLNEMKNPEAANKAEAIRMVRSEERTLKAAYNHIYEDWEWRKDIAFNKWKIARGKQIEAEFKVKRLRDEVDAASSVKAAKRLGWSIDVWDNIVMQQEVAVQTAVADLDQMETARLQANQNGGKPFADFWMLEYEKRQCLDNETDPEEKKMEKKLRLQWKVQQEAKKTDTHIGILQQQSMALTQQGAGRGGARRENEDRPRGGMTQDRDRARDGGRGHQERGDRERGDRQRGDRQREAREDREKDLFPPIPLVPGERVDASLRGCLVPDLGMMKLGWKGKNELDTPPQQGFKYKCGVCLRMGHSFMACGAKELSLPVQVYREGERKPIVTYRGLFYRGFIDAKGGINRGGSN